LKIDLEEGCGAEAAHEQAVRFASLLPSLVERAPFLNCAKEFPGAERYLEVEVYALELA
jgi:hypothetical protein